MVRDDNIVSLNQLVTNIKSILKNKKIITDELNKYKKYVCETDMSKISDFINLINVKDSTFVQRMRIMNLKPFILETINTVNMKDCVSSNSSESDEEANNSSNNDDSNDNYDSDNNNDSDNDSDDVCNETSSETSNDIKCNANNESDSEDSEYDKSTYNKNNDTKSIRKHKVNKSKKHSTNISMDKKLKHNKNDNPLDKRSNSNKDSFFCSSCEENDSNENSLEETSKKKTLNTPNVSDKLSNHEFSQRYHLALLKYKTMQLKYKNTQKRIDLIKAKCILEHMRRFKK